jgi:enoyl-CoA hydratase
MPFDNLLVDLDAGVATITINRPKVLNALNSQTIDELRRAILDLTHDRSIRAVILTGAGEKSFVSGADINELATLAPVDGKEYALRGQHVLNLIEHMGKPVLAAVNGYALGGGCELAMACSLRFAAEHARFGQPEVTLGLMPGYAGTQRLARLVGKGRALELLLSGETIEAQEARRIGLVNRVCASATLLSDARAFAARLAAGPPVAVRCIIDAVNRGLDASFEEGAFLEATLFGLVASTEDMREGTRAFLDKRKPEFKGR